MADDAAIAALATVTAIVTAFRMVGQRYLTKILETTDVRRLEGQLRPSEASDRVDELGRYEGFATWLPVGLQVVALGMFVVIAASFAIEPRASWPLVSLASVLLVWTASTIFVARRCSAFRDDLALLRAEAHTSSPLDAAEPEGAEESRP